MSSTPSAFSYAQAAKGQSMSRSVSQEESSINKQNLENSSEQNVEPKEDMKQPENSIEAPATVPTAIEASHTEDKSAVDVTPAENITEQIKSTSSKEDSSRVASASVTSNAVTTTGKEDGTSVTQADSESTWEKISQASNSELATDKSEDGSSKLSTWEQTKPQMKEAPVPTVNIWQKRMEDAQAKTGTKITPAVSKTEQPTSHVNGNVDYKRNPTKSFGSNAQGSFEDKGQQKSNRPIQSTPASGPPPPSTSDAKLWPTPDLAKSEDKKSVIDRPEQNEKDKPANKPHVKEKWEKVDFVPTAVFSTPIPTRGGARGGRIGGRGGREGVSRGASISSNAATSDRVGPANNAESQFSNTPSADRMRSGDTSVSRGGAAPKPKRSSSAGPTNFREPNSNDGSYERRESFNPRAGNAHRSYEQRRTSASTQPDTSVASGQSTPYDPQKRASQSFEPNGEPRFPRSERNLFSRPRDSASEHSGYTPTRDRGEGRPERGGRGSWRGKPGGQNHAGFNPNAPYQSNNQFVVGKPFSEQRHNSHPSPYSNGREPRHSRANSRSQSITNGQQFGRFGVQGSGPNGLPGLQTDVANNFAYNQQPAIMSAMPFNPYLEQVHLSAMVQMQLEYYLSVDNLCKDIFLRKNMDGQGFVFLTVLANFNRIQTLTTDINLLKWVCGRSPTIELRIGPDGLDRVRKAEDWQQWLLPSEERDPSAQNDGPAQLMSPRYESFPSGFGNFEGTPPPISQSTPMSPANGMMMNGFRGEPFTIDTNGQRNIANQETITQTPLSANVPDFQPSQSITGSRFQNLAEPEENFSDLNMGSLRIKVNATTSKNDVQDSKPKESLSNGLPKATETFQTAPKVNGATTHEHEVNGTAQLPNDSQKLSNGVSPHKQSPTKQKIERITWKNSPDSEDGESYDSFRSQALKARSEAAIGQCPDPMVDLYEFWSLFLTESFNIKVYQDFHSSALEDANVKQSLLGLNRLSEFYSRSLYKENLMADRLLKDFIDLVTVEFNNQYLPQERPAFTQLRKAWRNGAMNFANRLNLTKKLSEPLKVALDQDDYNTLP